MIYLLILIIILLITPIRVVITKDDDRSDIDFFYTRIFNLRLDFDELLRTLFTDENQPERLSAPKIIKTFKTLKEASPFIRTTTKMVSLDKLTLIIKTKGESLQRQTWNFVLSWTVISFLQNYIHGSFKNVKDEYYNQVPAEKTNIYFEFQFQIRLIYLLFSAIKNIKNLFKLIKPKKGRKKYGTASNS